MKMRTMVWAGLLAAGVSGTAIAGVPNVGKDFQPGAEAIMSMSHGHAQILKAFHTGVADMDGYAVQLAPGHAMIMYASADGKYLFMGGMFNRKGTNESMKYAHEYLPSADLPKVFTPAAMGAAVQKTAHFLIGDPSAPKTVWMVMDPNCVFCHLAYEHLLPYLKKGDVRIEVVPVGFLKPSSLPKAATILASKDPAKAWAYDEKHYIMPPTEEGGTVPLKHIPPSDIRTIQANNTWMNQHGIGGTPYLIYQGPKHQWHVVNGMPSDMASFVAGLG